MITAFFFLRTALSYSFGRPPFGLPYSCVWGLLSIGRCFFVSGVPGIRSAVLWHTKPILAPQNAIQYRDKSGLFYPYSRINSGIMPALWQERTKYL